jgi:hypothetical protein
MKYNLASKAEQDMVAKLVVEHAEIREHMITVAELWEMESFMMWHLARHTDDRNHARNVSKYKKDGVLAYDGAIYLQEFMLSTLKPFVEHTVKQVLEDRKKATSSSAAPAPAGARGGASTSRPSPPPSSNSGSHASASPQGRQSARGQPASRLVPAARAADTKGSRCVPNCLKAPKPKK